MAESYEIKPNRQAFVLWGFVKVLFAFLVMLVIGFVVSLIIGFSFMWIFIGFVVLSIFFYYYLTVRYRKERYIFLRDKVIFRRGGIFSDSETELIIRNITHVTMKLPFIQNKLFKTGHMAIESAGTGLTEIRISSIDNPGKMYEHIINIMKANGFKLTKKNLIEQERPSSVGVFFETFKNSLGGLFVIFLISGWILGAIQDGFGDVLMDNIVSLVVVFAILFIGLLIRTVLKFMDLKRRIYNIYSDMITYAEGFLSKNYSFMPIENLSDSTTTQTIIDRIFGLYDLKISCQGSKQEIVFKNVANGPKMESNVDALIKKTKALIRSLKKEKAAKAETIAGYQAKGPKGDMKYTDEFRMDMSKTLVPLLITLPLVPIWLMLTVVEYIKVKATKYVIKPSSMREEFKFIATKNKEFSNDKITAITFKESFVDRWFSTCSIRFWSIGSSEDIKFTNIKKTEGLYEKVLSKAGIGKQEVLYQMDSDFTIGSMLKAVLPVTLGIILFAICCIFAAAFFPVMAIPLTALFFICLIITVYKKIYYRRSKMTFFKDYVYFQRGIFFKEFYYVLYDNIKDIKTVKYPFSKRGSVKFNIAGEHMEQKGKNKQMMVSNSFKINYIFDIDNKDELIDMIFYKRPSAHQIKSMEQNIEKYKPKPIIISKPDLANGVVITSILGLLVLPALPFLLIYVIWRIKVTKYMIQPYRVVFKTGILYKTQISIVFNKIDHINYSQGILNKMFNNGNITVNTTGSSMPELMLHSMHNYKEFYGELKKYY